MLDGRKDGRERTSTGFPLRNFYFPSPSAGETKLSLVGRRGGGRGAPLIAGFCEFSLPKRPSIE